VISIVIPAFNEALRLPPTLLLATDYLEGREYEIIVVDDGSSDQTVEVVLKMSKLRPNIRLISLSKNQGKGKAVRTGLNEAKFPILGFIDADGATPIEEIDKLIKSLNDGADIAIGSRALKESKVETLIHRRALGRVFNFFVNLISVPGIADTQCGFKFFKKEAFQKIYPFLTCDRFGFDVEILLLAQKLKLKISEVPISWTNIPGSKVNLLTDSTQMLFDIIRFRWMHRKVASK